MEWRPGGPARKEIPTLPEKTAAAHPGHGLGVEEAGAQPGGEVSGWASQAEEDAGPPERGDLPGRQPKEGAGLECQPRPTPGPERRSPGAD
jgi:hypothetical protein